MWYSTADLVYYWPSHPLLTQLQFVIVWYVLHYYCLQQDHHHPTDDDASTTTLLPHHLRWWLGLGWWCSKFGTHYYSEERSSELLGMRIISITVPSHPPRRGDGVMNIYLTVDNGDHISSTFFCEGVSPNCVYIIEVVASATDERWVMMVIE